MPRHVVRFSVFHVEKLTVSLQRLKQLQEERHHQSGDGDIVRALPKKHRIEEVNIVPDAANTVGRLLQRMDV